MSQRNQQITLILLLGVVIFWATRSKNNDFIAPFIAIILLAYYLTLRNTSHFASREELNDVDRIKERLTVISPIQGLLSKVTFLVSDDGNTYTENKKNIFFCTRQPNGEVYDDNTLIYVALHELAHVMSKSVDTDEHSPEFYRNFDYLLDLASQAGVYNPCVPIAEFYCGVDIPPQSRVHMDHCIRYQKNKQQ